MCARALVVLTLIPLAGATVASQTTGIREVSHRFLVRRELST